MKPLLHPIKHDLPGAMLWCGPAAISAITGQPTSVVHEAIKQDRGNRRPVRGVFHGELFRVMRRLGFEVVENIDGQRQTVIDFAERIDHLSYRWPLVACTRDHYFCLAQGLIVDSRTEPTPFHLTPVRGRVERAWAFGCFAAPDLPKPYAETAEGAAMKNARALARKHGVKIDRLGERYWHVWCPLLADDDPLEGDNDRGTEADVLEAVERYVKCLTTGYLEAVTDPALMPA